MDSHTSAGKRAAHRSIRHFAAMLSVILATGSAFADDSLAILPSRITLSGSQARQTILVQNVQGDRFGVQVTDGARLESSDPNVVRIEEGIAIPVGDGRATITATVGDRKATAEAVVKEFDSSVAWSFRNHVQPVLSKAGCNSGACHGAAAGKNGFKLSLRGYDPDFDYHAITRQSGGRRVVPSDPGRSLLLTKPTGAIPHKGGLRLKVNSRDYRVVAEWLASGHAPPDDADSRLTRLEILPNAAVLNKQSKQQTIVLAHYSDGRTEEVTSWAKYTSTNLSVAKVDDQGRVEVTGNGEGAVVAWFLGFNVVASVTVPYATDIPAEVYQQAPRNNFIDTLVLEKLQSLNIPPSDRATDSEFIRRAYLDTIGILPSADETRKFLADASPDKRTKLADRLLTRPEFVDYWTYKWSDLLLVSGSSLRAPAVKSYYNWIRRHVEANTPWDQFVREIVTSKGSTITNGSANFYKLHEDPLDIAETVSMAFLGMSINCARCHDHPLEKWTNDDYYAMGNLFARVRGKGWGGDGGDENRSIFSANEGELIQPRTGRPQPPRPLDGKPISFESTEDRREYLAEWLTAPENPYFTRAIVNRVWANFLGAGIVENVDDLRLTNPPSNEALLDALAAELVRNDYNLKRLMRVILTSSTYGRSSRPRQGNEADERYYSRYYPRRLKAEVLLDALSQATSVPTKFSGYPEGTRALQLRDTDVASYFLNRFGRPERKLTCECERSDVPSMVQVLHIMNGDTLNSKLEAENNRLTVWLSAKTSHEQIIDEAYLSALCRYPTPSEKSRIMEVLADSGATEQRAVIEDLCWSILSSKEFLFNH